MIIFNLSGVSHAEDESKVIAYYFHGTFRCFSCHRIEEFTEGAIKEYFSLEIENGTLDYKVINMEEKNNEHFARDYQLYTKSVVLSLVEQGKEVKYKNLDKVWQYLGDKDEFYEYIKKETQSFLNETDKEEMS
jgi:hypothetical protein